MTTALRVLIVEDVPDDAELMAGHLSQAGLKLDWRRVDTEADFVAALGTLPDLVLADWRLPHFSGLRALELMRERGLDIPFVIVSGSIGEEAAVDAMRQGAYDYVLKDRPARLGQAVEHALEDKQLRDERRRAEATLRESEERYRTLFNDLPVGVYKTNADGRILEANPALAALFGYDSPGDLVGTNVRKFYADAEGHLRRSKSVTHEGALFETDVQVRRKDGLLIWALESGRIVRDESGQLMYYEGMLSDITERRGAEERLRESEAALRRAQQVAHVGSWVWHIQENRVEWSEEMVHVFGLDQAALSGDMSQVVAAAVHPEDREAVERANEAVLREQRPLPMEYRILRSDGQVRTVWAEAGDLTRDEAGRPAILTGIVQDITERKLAERTLRESEERYRKLVELSPDSIGIHCDGKVVYVNPATVKLFHARGPEDLIGLPVMELIHSDSRAIAMERVRQSYEDSVPAALSEEAIVTLDGQLIEVEIRATPVVHDGKPARQIIVRDITERKKAEQALRESEERYRAMIHSASDAIVSIDSAGSIVGWNPGAEHMFGYAESELDGQPLTRLLPAHVLPGYLAGIERLRSGGEAQIIGRTLETEGRQKDGQVLPLELSLSEWQVADATCYTAIIRDITERKRAEEALRKQVTEMEALYQTSLEILARNDLPDLLKAIVENGARLTGGDRGALFLPTADGSRIRLHISHNLGRDYIGTELELGEGLSGQAAEEHRTIMIEDYSAWEGKSPKFSEESIGRILAIPMQVGERLIGVLIVADSKTGSYGEDDIRLASLFADQAAMAIESARLVSETTRRAAYLEALTGTAGALRGAVKPQEMYADVLGQVVDQLKASGATLALVDSESGRTESVLAVGAWTGTTGMHLSPGEGIIGMVTSSGQAFVSNDIRGDPRLARPELLQDLPAIACVPLTVEDRIVGCVMVGRIEPLSAEEVRLLTGLAEISGNAIYRMQVMETLETRVRQRTQELEAANERLQELDRLKTDFVSNVTHELRTPITNMLLYLDLARRTSSEPKRAHYFDVLKSESVRLGTLIESVLTLSRLERGVVPMDLEPNPLDGLLADVLVGYQARAEAKGIVLDHEPDESLPVSWVNRAQMHQVLTNLVGNAVAYTPPGGQVHLRTARTQVGGRDYVGVVIHNTGTVIPPQEMGHLFERFYRGRTGRESGEPGTGLGLAISREIVELHHGWIDVESSEQGGTIFTVWLPEEAPAG